MGLSSIAMILLYIYMFVRLQDKPYYITRARVQVTEIIEFESVKVNKLLYFLYRNRTEGASDDSSTIVTNLTQLCGGNGYALFPDLNTVDSIRYNMGSGYMFASVVYTLLLIVVISGFNVVYVSYHMKEH